ncbi:hypothetical protein MMC2321_00033 [Chitinophaga sp. MM2321]
MYDNNGFYAVVSSDAKSTYPAKDGHVMVSEYDRKERSTRYSIESL